VHARRGSFMEPRLLVALRGPQEEAADEAEGDQWDNHRGDGDGSQSPGRTVDPVPGVGELERHGKVHLDKRRPPRR
jgi:hypothetical protein